MLVSSSALLVALFFGGAAAKAVNLGALQPDHFAKTAQVQDGIPACMKSCDQSSMNFMDCTDIMAKLSDNSGWCGQDCDGEVKQMVLKMWVDNQKPPVQCPPGSDALDACASTCQMPEDPNVDMCDATCAMMNGCAKSCPQALKKKKIKEICGAREPPCGGASGGGGRDDAPPPCASTCQIPLVPGPGVDMCAMVTGMMDGCAKTCPAKMKEEKLKDFCPRGSGGGGGDDAPPPCASTCQIPEPGPGVDMCAVVKGMMDGCAKGCPEKMKQAKLEDVCGPQSVDIGDSVG